MFVPVFSDEIRGGDIEIAPYKKRATRKSPPASYAAKAVLNKVYERPPRFAQLPAKSESPL